MVLSCMAANGVFASGWCDLDAFGIRYIGGGDRLEALDGIELYGRQRGFVRANFVMAANGCCVRTATVWLQRTAIVARSAPTIPR
jgi:hypothetical protein